MINRMTKRKSLKFIRKCQRGYEEVSKVYSKVRSHEDLVTTGKCPKFIRAPTCHGNVKVYSACGLMFNHSGINSQKGKIFPQSGFPLDRESVVRALGI